MERIKTGLAWSRYRKTWGEWRSQRELGLGKHCGSCLG